ncbi:Imm5 family immunity protein [Zobellia laminariae]|uniref:Imm5 family immunity protein n=1 Tax=Zobellia laminariae TaxID=248906 RepID=UPI0026F43F5A|nr:Imm5 family immunity protein [Zobellia laminariae]WKX76170.1 Imm5 family immunity protein [Zobellia laminariae]
METSQNSHLPLKYRVEIAKSLGAELVNKVFLECCKKVYLNFNENDININYVLKLAEDFLFNKKEVDFKKLINEYRNYFETINVKPTSGIALSVLSLIYNLEYNAALILDIDDYKSQDDNEFDWEEWNPDFIASNVFSEGNPFLNEGDSEKRKEFWLWYLNTVDGIKANPNKSILQIDAKVNVSEGPVLKRDISSLINTEVENKINRVINLVKNDLKEGVIWDKIEIEGENLKTGKSMRAYFFNDETKIKISLTFFLQSGDKSSVTLMEQIKEEMYLQNKNQGAWLNYRIDVENDGTYSFNFNYDDIKLLPENKQRPDNFIPEFKAFPRNKNLLLNGGKR